MVATPAPPAALRRAQLDKFTCQTQGCTCSGSVLYVHGRCHPTAPYAAQYDSRTGALAIVCSACSELIMRIEVAP